MDGSGTKQDPYLVTSVKELQAINRDLCSHYRLECDIEAGKTAEWNDGGGFSPIGDFNHPFSGSLDGNTHKIKNMFINRPDRSWVGVFGVNTGEIENLCVKGTTVSGNRNTGCLAGVNRGEVVSSCTKEVEISGCTPVGGLIGRNWGTVESSYSIGGDISGSDWVGGLIGENPGSVELSYAIGDVSGNKYVGSLIGHNDGFVRLSYAAGEVSGERSVGGLIGGDCHSDYTNSSLVFYNRHRENIEGYPDIIISRNNCVISYIIDTKMLYLDFNGQTYYCSGVSVPIVQKLAEGLIEHVVWVTENFRASVVKMI